jgi:hypothetical protein
MGLAVSDTPWNIRVGSFYAGYGWRNLETCDQAPSMFNVRVYLTNACLACFDLAVTAACYFALRPAQTGTLVERAALVVFVLGLWLVLSFHFGMYRSRRLDSLLADMVIIFKISLASWILIQACAALLPASLAGFPVVGFGRYLRGTDRGEVCPARWPERTAPAGTQCEAPCSDCFTGNRSQA